MCICIYLTFTLTFTKTQSFQKLDFRQLFFGKLPKTAFAKSMRKHSFHCVFPMLLPRRFFKTSFFMLFSTSCKNIYFLTLVRKNVMRRCRLCAMRAGACMALRCVAHADELLTAAALDTSHEDCRAQYWASDARVWMLIAGSVINTGRRKKRALFTRCVNRFFQKSVFNLA